MCALPRPAKRIKPKPYYTEYLPELWTHIAGDVAWPDWGGDIGVVIDGDEEEYTLTLDRNGLSAREVLGDTTLVTFRIQRDSWDMFVYDLWPQMLKRMDKEEDRSRRDFAWFAETGYASFDIRSIRQMPGSVHIRYTDDAGDVMEMSVDVGDGRGPSVSVNAKDADLWALMDSRGKVVNLVKSKLQLDGDVAYLIKLARFIEGS